MKRYPKTPLAWFAMIRGAEMDSKAWRAIKKDTLPAAPVQGGILLAMLESETHGVKSMSVAEIESDLLGKVSHAHFVSMPAHGWVMIDINHDRPRRWLLTAAGRELAMAIHDRILVRMTRTYDRMKEKSLLPAGAGVGVPPYGKVPGDAVFRGTGERGRVGYSKEKTAKA